MQTYRDLFVTASDGLSLHAREYGPPAGGAIPVVGLPVVCLPGLARTAADFHPLAEALAGDAARPRRVLALDYRGRGLSDRDPDWRRYDVRVELADVLQVLTVAGIEEAVFVGTSRGGLITMALGAARPALIRAAVLNDIGPVIDAKGLIRIRGYVGKMPRPRSWAEAAQIMRRLSDAQFPTLTEEDWLAIARATFQERDGRLEPAYDPALLKSLEALDLESPLPALWFLFAGLRAVPVLAIRGANSDLLSAETLAAMASRHPRLTAVTIPDEGHAPLVRGEWVAMVQGFIRDVEMSPQAPVEAA